MTWVKARGRNILPSIPCRAMIGMKVRAMMSSPKMDGLRTSRTALSTVGSFLTEASALAEVALDVLHLDDGRVDDHADRDGQTAEGHEVGRQPEQAHHDEREQDRERQGQEHDEGAAEAAQEQVEDEDDEQGADEQRLGDRVDGPVDDVGPLVIGHDAEAERQDARRVDLGDPALDGPDDVAAVGAAQHHDDAADDLALPVLDRAALPDRLPGPNLGDVADEDRSSACPSSRPRRRCRQRSGEARCRGRGTVARPARGRCRRR